MGSFLNCCAYRMCHKLSIASGRSKCDHCNHVLGAKDLVPVLSYIFSKGRCRYCGEKLNPMYPASELIGGLSFLLVFLRFGLTLKTPEILILASLMMLASFADMEDYIIPDITIVLGIVNRIVFVFINGDIRSELLSSIKSSLIMGLSLYLLVIVMEKVLKKEAMGGGDIKLVFMLSLYIGIPECLFAMLVSCIAGLAFSLIKRNGEGQFPFGPALCIAYFISILYGSTVVDFYLSLF